MKYNRLKFNKNKRILLICMSLLLLAGSILLYLNQLKAYEADDPTKDLNSERSQGLVIGDGIPFDNKQKEIHENQQEKFEEAQKIKLENDRDPQRDKGKDSGTDKTEGNGNTADSDNNNGIGDDGNGTGSGGNNGGNGNSDGQGDDGKNNSGGEETDPTLPQIDTDLKNNKTYGSEAFFWVKAKDYNGRYIDSFSLKVEVNKERERSTVDTGEKVKYSAELKDGENSITITAVDKHGKSASKTFTVYGDSAKKNEEEGTVTLSIEVKTLGLGYILAPTEVTIYKGEQLSKLLVRVLNEKGIGYTNSGSVKSNFYLKKIKQIGITDGFKINDDLLDKIAEEGFDEIGGYSKDSIGEGDFFKGSGWMFCVNGEYKNGFSATYPTDGDEVRIRFTLWYSRDIGGENSWMDI